MGCSRRGRVKDPDSVFHHATEDLFEVNVTTEAHSDNSLSPVSLYDHPIYINNPGCISNREEISPQNSHNILQQCFASIINSR